jgi:hypothetical protein
MGRAAVALTLTLVTAGSVIPGRVRAQPQARPAQTLAVPSPPINASNSLLLESVERIGRRSGLWRDAIHTIGKGGGSIVLLTPDQVIVAETLDGDDAGSFDATTVAAAAPVPSADNRVQTVLVVVNLPLIEEVHHRMRSLPGELHADLDQILVHEVYGHAVPYLLAGHLWGKCADPAPGERAADACAIRRENDVRKELGLGRRTWYGLEGLTLARRSF